MALRPIHGRAVWARRPASVDREAHRALAAGLDHAVGRLAEQGDVARQQVGPLGEQAAEAVVLGVDLLGLVEDVGHVDGGLGHGAGQLEHDGQAGLHVGRAAAPTARRPRRRAGSCR